MVLLARVDRHPLRPPPRHFTSWGSAAASMVILVVAVSVFVLFLVAPFVS